MNNINDIYPKTSTIRIHWTENNSGSQMLDTLPYSRQETRKLHLI